MTILFPQAVQTNRTADTGAAVAAVSSRILRQVLLVIILGIVERRRVGNLGRDPTVARGSQPILISRARRFGGTFLLGENV